MSVVFLIKRRSVEENIRQFGCVCQRDDREHNKREYQLKKMKKKQNSNNGDSNKKQRHIVSWSQEEDNILRDQISLHGTDNWAIIASNFKDKTTRQCRRRWYTYLNSDFKTGGWSPEEDMLLCEAQRIFGNRWTEIAKVVSGRTDNAVKNRFRTLCKKRAKSETMSKARNDICLNSNDKRMLLLPGAAAGNAPAAKKSRRSHILDLQNCRESDCNLSSSDVSAVENHVNDHKKVEDCGKFLKKDDPKTSVLMQQAELLNSLAEKVKSENAEQSMESAWKVLQDFLKKSEEGGMFSYGLPDFELGDVQSSNEESEASWRQPDLYESPASSEYSTESTIMLYPLLETQPFDIQDLLALQSIDMEKQIHTLAEVPSPCDAQTKPDSVASDSLEQDFSSPLQVTPLFRSLAAGIPTPQFSESERSFLLKTLGIESPTPCPNANPSCPPPCKRVLLHSL